MHIHEYERYWIIAVVATLGAFLASLMAGAAIFGVRLPTPEGFVNPQRLDESALFAPDALGKHDRGDDHYDLHILARQFVFDVGGDLSAWDYEVGDTVTFYITSEDVIHGFIIEKMNTNFEILPGHIASASVTFKEPGRYRVVCHQYCGTGHQAMYSWLNVSEPSDDAEDVAAVEGDE